MGRSSAGTARRALDDRAFGIAPDITAKRNGLPPRSMPPKLRWRSRKARHEPASTRTCLSGSYRHRRSGMGFYLSFTVGGEESRASPRVGREVRTRRRSPGRQDPALTPRTGRRIAEGTRVPQEWKEGSAEQPPDTSPARLVNS